MQPPSYFEPIRLKAAKRWTVLDGDPEDQGVWRSLFQQVQDPRHVLSELLQNADDAGATEATVRLEDHCFVFTHNGEDFTEGDFASLCRFCYSNKRTLHTIGFRGIGFKSTFSLGDTVEVRTPTLSVVFKQQRFTEPRWQPVGSVQQDRTEIRVAISDPNRELDVEKNLREWSKSPVSLLFFRDLHRLQIGERDLHWGSLGPGPVPETQWWALHDDPDHEFLLVSSAPEPFPGEALAEIRQERMIIGDQEIDFPPCKVEIVIGASGRLYVALPTGVQTTLPFACNAPFVQEPARVNIKPPATSPTNRWLLDRLGSLAATVMLRWLEDASLSLEERSQAYQLLPNVDGDGDSLESGCLAAVRDAFVRTLDDRPHLLTNSGDLKPVKQAVSVPDELFNVWTAKEVEELIDSGGRPSLSRHVRKRDRDKLIRWEAVESVTKEDVLDALTSKCPPKTENWRCLMKLWAYVAPEVTNYLTRARFSQLRIVPVHGKDELYSAGEVVRLGEGRLLKSDDDWKFLSTHLLVLDQNWLRFLAGRQGRGGDPEDGEFAKKSAAALEVLKALGLEDTSRTDSVVGRAVEAFFAQKTVPIEGCVQIAQIAAKLRANVSDSLRLCTVDQRLRQPTDVVLCDLDGTLDGALPEEWRNAHLLHPDYMTTYRSCSSDDWREWIRSGRAGVRTSIPLEKVSRRFSWYSHFENYVGVFANIGSPEYPYSYERHYSAQEYVVVDSDFPAAIVEHWQGASPEGTAWRQALSQIILCGPDNWKDMLYAKLLQSSTNGQSWGKVKTAPIPAAWVRRFQGLECLPDTHGNYRRPADLLRLTRETEALVDVEAFIDRRWDTEQNVHLLMLLGVRDTPPGPDRILDCIRALAKSERPPVSEVEKWYRRLDQMADTCSTADLNTIRESLLQERIVFTDDGEWFAGSGVYLAPDEEAAPGVAVVRSTVRDLSLWRKIGIAERPTPESAIEWLRSLSTDEKPPPNTNIRVRALLARYPHQIWKECHHWLNLAGEWAPTDGLSYALTNQTSVQWRNLFEWVLQKTADLQSLSLEVTASPPFSELALLSRRVHDRLHHEPLASGKGSTRQWLAVFGTELRRIELEPEEEQTRIRALAEAMANLRWISALDLEITPYIDGTPVGTPRQADVVWADGTLYEARLSRAKLAMRVPEELGKAFGRPDIKTALDYSFERSTDDVREYLEERFRLAPRQIVPDLEQEDGVTPLSDPVEGDRGADTRPAETDDSPMANGDASGTEDLATPIEGDEGDGQDRDTTTEDTDDCRGGTPAHRDRKLATPSIIERFARLRGFTNDGNERFSQSDGSWIGKTKGEPFPWEARTAAGDLLRYYWPKDHCLERKPLELEAGVWGLIEKFPDTYALILLDPQGEPVEVPGERLLALRESGNLKIFPASYRLVVDHD